MSPIFAADGPSSPSRPFRRLEQLDPQRLRYRETVRLLADQPSESLSTRGCSTARTRRPGPGCRSERDAPSISTRPRAAKRPESPRSTPPPPSSPRPSVEPGARWPSLAGSSTTSRPVPPSRPPPPRPCSSPCARPEDHGPPGGSPTRSIEAEPTISAAASRRTSSPWWNPSSTATSAGPGRWPARRSRPPRGSFAAIPWPPSRPSP